MTDTTHSRIHSWSTTQDLDNALPLHNSLSTSVDAPTDLSARNESYRAPVLGHHSDRNDMHARRDANDHDTSLYLADGDCSIYLCHQDEFSNDASFKIYYQTLLDKRCDPLLARCIIKSCSESSSQHPSSQSGCKVINDVDLYLPSPVELSEEDARRWHVSTQNFVAWLLRRPLTGDNLGYALVELLNRMVLFRGDDVDNVGDILSYARQVGYANFVDSPNHALAFLFFADYCRKRDLWVDAFAHCVGMAEIISASPEYEPNNLVTKLLIKRAKLEMDLHMTRTSNTLARLLDQEIPFFGFTTPARRHLDYFQSIFLHPYLVSKYGYWPPPGDDPPMSTYRALCFDLEDLYDYLADRKSVGDAATFGFASGGICVRQQIDAFNKRHKMTPLPYEMPLLPELNASQTRLQRQRSLTAFKRSIKDSKASKIDSYRRALLHASNRDEYTVLTSPLVQAYMQFEYTFASESEQNLDFSESRKIRWIFVYALLQTALSIVRVPSEVTDTETSYPLCCLTLGIPNWSSRSSVFLQNSNDDRSGENGEPRKTAVNLSTTSTWIQPDCDPSYRSVESTVDSKTGTTVAFDDLGEPVEVALEAQQQSIPDSQDALSKKDHGSNASSRRALSEAQSFSQKATYADYQQIAQSQAIHSVDSLLYKLAIPPPEPEFSASLDSGSDSLPAIRWSTRFTNVVESEDTGDLDIPDLDSSSETSSFESSIGNRASFRTEATRSSQSGSTVYIQTSRGKTVLRSDDLPASITRGYSHSNRLSSSSVVETLQETESTSMDTVVINYSSLRKAQDEVVESPVIPAFFSNARSNIPGRLDALQ